MKDQFTITSIQLFILLVSMMLGIGVLSLPREVTERVGTSDSWLTVLITGILTCVPIFVIAKISNVFPGQHFLDYTKQILGKYVAWVLGLAAAIYFVMLFALEIRAIGALVQLHLLPKTPLGLLVLLPLMASVYLTTGGGYAVTRLNEMMLPFLIIVYIVVLLLSAQQFDMDNILPVLHTDLTEFVNAIPASTFSFLLSNVFFILSGYLKEPEKSYAASIAAVLSVCLLNTLTVLIAIGVFGPESVKTLIWPTLEMIKNIDIRGALFERIESVFLTIWISKIFLLLSLSHYSAGLLLKDLFKGNLRFFGHAVVPVAYIIAMIPHNLTEMFQLQRLINSMEIIFTGILPFVLLGIARIRKLGTYSANRSN